MRCTAAAKSGAPSRPPRTELFPGSDAERAFSAWCPPRYPSRPAQNESRMADLIAAMAGDQRNFRVFHLASGGIGMAELAHAFDDLQHAFDMGFRQLAAGRVG